MSRASRDVTEQKKVEQLFLRKQRMESIGSLAGGIAHDLNNALTPIMMGIDLLNQTLVDEDSQQLLQHIGSSARHGANMVQQLLLFARGVEGQRLEVTISRLVADVEEVANDTFLKRIHVRTDIADDIWQVTGDATQLNQVVMNLSVNARDAMPSGGTLSITAGNVVVDAQTAAPHADAKPGPYVRIRRLGRS